MPGGLGLRFAFEAAFIVAVAVLTIVANFSWQAILVTMLLAWALIALVEWARAQAASIMSRAQHGAEQLLRAAGLGDDAIGEVAAAIVRAVEPEGEPEPVQPAPEEPPAPPPAAEGGEQASGGEPEPPSL